MPPHLFLLQILHKHRDPGQKWECVPWQESGLPTSCPEESNHQCQFPEEWKGTVESHLVWVLVWFLYLPCPYFISPCQSETFFPKLHFRSHTKALHLRAMLAYGPDRAQISSLYPVTSEVRQINLSEVTRQVSDLSLNVCDFAHKEVSIGGTGGRTGCLRSCFGGLQLAGWSGR